MRKRGSSRSKAGEKRSRGRNRARCVRGKKVIGKKGG